MIILDHPYAFFFSYFVLSMGLGAWLTWIFVRWEVRRLKNRIEMMKAWGY